MASEFTINGSLSYEDSEGTDILAKLPADFVGNITTKVFSHFKKNIGITEEALPLGEVSSLGWAFFINWDPTNYLEIRSGTGAANDIIKIEPGASAGPFKFGSDITAPYAIANTAACQLEGWIFSV